MMDFLEAFVRLVAAGLLGVLFVLIVIGIALLSSGWAIDLQWNKRWFFWKPNAKTVAARKNHKPPKIYDSIYDQMIDELKENDQ